MIVLGFDPGLAATGFGIVEAEAGRLRLVVYGCIRTPATLPQPERLAQIFEEAGRLFKLHRPTTVAVERLFFNRNTTSAFDVGHARGILLLLAALEGLPVAEYTPLQVKQALVGYGRAEKRQIQEMTKMILGLETAPRPDDAADAVAVAVCHCHSARMAGLAAGAGIERCSRS
ncbi:MAG: crossover junction endodeoxyribonuclease RuvC [Firmicutes bacterium]|nr:crossover junction endodeoxyribonuclease RuvC [Bacillota bacterium]